MPLGSTRIQRWRVPLGFACAAIFLIFARPTAMTLVIGGLVSLMGLVIRGWAAGHIRKNTALAVAGPYAYTRNPLYLGSFIMGVGFTIAAGRWWLGLLFAALFLGIYLPVMRVESTTLASVFGDDYRRYHEAVPLFLPRLTRFTTDDSVATEFDRTLYLKYREYRAALGVVVAWGVLAAKAYFLR